MVYGAMIGIGQQILLAHISDVAAVSILGEKMVEGLVFARAHAFGDRLIPFLAVRKHRINVEHHPAKIEHPVANNITNGIAGLGSDRHFRIRAHAAYIAARAASFNLALGKAKIIR